MFINSTWDVKEPTDYSRRVGLGIPGVVAVLCVCMAGYKKVIYLAWDIHHHALLYKSGQKQVQRK